MTVPVRFVLPDTTSSLWHPSFIRTVSLVSNEASMKTLTDDFGLRALPVLTRDTAPNPARMRRETLLLDGLWNLSVNDGPIAPVQVPFAPQSKINGIKVPDGDATLRYATTFELPRNWTGALLHLEGVDHDAEVSVNGVHLVRHTGAWDPIGVF